jgi:23S rRNA (adenine2503-C2)-methyltransferase
MIPLPANLDPLALTLAQYAAARETHPQALREAYRSLLRETPADLLPAILRRTDDPVDGTIKFCLPADASNDAPPKTLESESVIIPMTSFRGKSWHTLCVSSQVGCRMGCTFCETGRMGLVRNLTAGQIVRQRLAARRIRAENPGPLAQPSAAHLRYFSDGIQNIVFMGMGEPLDNLDNVLQAIRVLTEPAGLDFPFAQITVSTVGRIDGLRKLAELCAREPAWRNLRIAISLNAATEGLRNELMPINKAMPLTDLRQTLLAYPLSPKGRFLIEYVMIKGVNDTPADAAAVADFCRTLPCIVNLIPYNPQRFAAYQTPDDATILAFMADLKARGLFVKRRVTHGKDLMGACGQLGNPEIHRRSAGTAGGAGGVGGGGAASGDRLMQSLQLTSELRVYSGRADSAPEAFEDRP